MITKIAELYYSGADCFVSRNVKGFNKAILEFKVPSGCTLRYFYVYKSSDGSTPNSFIGEISENGYQLGIPTRIVPNEGTHKYIINIAGCTNIRVLLEYDSTEPRVEVTNASLCLIQESIENNVTPCKRLISGANINTDVRDYNSASVNITVPSGSTCPFSVKGTYDGSVVIQTSPGIGFYIGGVKVYNTISLTEGNYTFRIDLKNVTNLGINTSNAICQVLLNRESADFRLKKMQINSISPVVIDTSEYNSLDVKITSDSETVYSIKNYLDNTYVPCYAYGVKLLRDFNLNIGENIIKVDCRNIDKVIFYKATGLEITPSMGIVDDSVLEETVLCSAIPIFLFGKGKQLDFTIETPNTNKSIILQGSNDGFSTTENIVLYDKDVCQVLSGLVADGVTRKIFANIEGYNEVRLYCQGFVSAKDKYTIKDIIVSDEYLEGRKIGNYGPTARPFLRGYKYLKINFKPSGYINGVSNQSSIKDCSARTRVRVDYVEVIPTFYDRGMNKAKFPTIGVSPFSNYWCLYGTPSQGGFIMEFDSPLSGNIDISVAYQSSSETLPGYECTSVFDVECYVNKPKADTCYIEKADKNDYRIYELPSQSVNRDVLNNDVLEWTDNALVFWHGGYLGVRYDIPFTADNVAHYVSGEKIKFAYLLPFKGSAKTYRKSNVGRILNPSRIVVFTKTRVFHNFPNRVGMNAPCSDLFMFDESAIYNRFKVLPVNDKNKVDSFHKYFPVLAEYNYSQFDNRIGTTGDNDPYGNGGLPSDAALQDILVNTANFWNRLTYSNMTKNQLYCAFGNYNGGPGEEAFVMVTTNGGIEWYVHAYFAGTDFYNYMRGGKVSLTPITDVAGSYVANSLKMCRKRFNIPTDAVKEPANPFIIKEEDKSLVTSFSVDGNGDCIVTVADNVDYDGVYPIVYFENVSANSEWNYICNSGVTSSSSGNNRFFRVSKVSPNTYKLYGDLGNPNPTDLICRHIHAVNATQAGILISTGESYGVTPPNFFEGGFMYMMQHIQNNGDQVAFASGTYPWRVITRLNSSPQGAIRAAGAYLFCDEADPTLLYVSDEAFIVGENHKRYAALPEGRNDTLPLTPGGIYVGKLSDIDDQKKFKCVCDVFGTVVGLTENHGHFAADGHYKSICLSKDGFNWNIEMDDNSHVNGFDNYGNIYFGNKVVVFK